MTNTTKLALGAAAVAAAIEYPLSQKYPLAEPVPVGNRMAVAAGLTFVGVIVASWFVSSEL